MEYSESIGKQLEAIMGKYVNRGDPAVFDFTLTDFTRDNLWHDLDLSGIVAPAGANHLAHIFLKIKNISVQKDFHLREKGNLNDINVFCARSQSANIGNPQDGWVMMDATRKIQYKAATNNWTEIDVAVRGWIEA